MATQVRSRAWCITINNPSDGDKEQLVELIETQCLLGIAEMEHTEGEGTPHVQGYVKFSNQKTLSQISRLLPRAHLEKAFGTWKENWKYCSKEGTVFIEKGHTLQEAENGNIIPFDQMYQDMKTMAPDEFEDKYPKEWYMRKDKVMAVMIQHAMSHTKEFNGDLPAKNWWIWGAPGVGKSRWAASNGSYCEIFKKNFNKWWDGYNLLTTKFVIIEDYPCAPQGNALVQHMKIWADRYPFEAECKGSHMLVEPGRFFLIVTSNYPIDSCFCQEEDKEAIHRRFKEVQMIRGDLMSLGDFTLDRKIINQEE